MSTHRVLVSDYVFESFAQEREILGAVDAELEVLQCESAEELRQHMPGVHGLLNTYLPGIDADVFDNAPDLRVVVRYGIGLDTIDIPEATKRGIIVANVPDYCIDEVADHAMAHFMTLARKIPLSDRRVRAGEWSLAYVKPLKSLQSMRAGVIGFGRIGRAIARRLKAFGTEVVFADPMINAVSDGCEPVDLDTLFASSDAIFVQCPATPATRHLLCAGAFAKMEKCPIIINCARGEIVDTDAVVAALESGAIAGAGLDLLDDEDAVVKADHPLKRFENVTLTPHSAWFSDASIPNLQKRAAEEMAKALTGQRPSSLVNPEVMERNGQ